MTLEPSGERTTTSSVTCDSPFTLGPDPTVMPAGTYVIHTRELIYTGALRTSYVAVSVELEVQDAPGRTSYRCVKPADLADALTKAQLQT